MNWETPEIMTLEETDSYGNDGYGTCPHCGGVFNKPLGQHVSNCPKKPSNSNPDKLPSHS